MYDIDWLYDQQEVLCSYPEGEVRISTKSDFSRFVANPETDRDFLLRMYARPDLHKKIYPNIPISKWERPETSSRYVVPSQENEFPSDPKKDPYFLIRQAIRPDLHKEYYPNIPIS